MKLAIIGDEMAQDMRLVADKCVGLAFDGVEVRSAFNTPAHLLTSEQLGEVRDVLAERGIAVAGFASPALKCSLPNDDRSVQHARDSVRRAAEQAAVLGAPHVRIFSWYHSGVPDPLTAASIAREVLSGLRFDVRLLLESGTRTNTPTMYHMIRFLQLLDEDRVGILWDPGNSVFSGWHQRPFPADYLLARGRIGHIHVKDPRGQREYVRLGDGDLPWPGILQRLADDGYDGFVSLETHWREGRVLNQRERDEPWGESFSRGGLNPSLECMRRLAQWRDALLAGKLK